MFKKNLTLTILLISLCSCKVGPDYKTPELSLPKSWQDNKNKDQASKDSIKDWWQIFNDKTLTSLIEEASKQNLDLKSTKAKIAEARASRGIAESALYPSVGVRVNALRSKQIIPQIGGSFLYNNYNAGFDASWELGLFGDTKRKFESAVTSMEAIEFDQDVLAISIFAEIAKNYIDFRNFQNQLLIANNNLAAQEKITQLIEQQFKIGKVSKLELLQSKSQLEIDKSAVATITSQEKSAEYKLEALLGKQPGDLELILSPVEPIPVTDQQLILKTPAEVIAARPDIKAAERRLASATAMQGVATSYKYPQINISAFLVINSSDFHDLFFSPAPAWSLGAGILSPIINHGKINLGIESANAKQEQSHLEYEKTILNALRDTSTSLATYVEKDALRKNIGEAADDSKNIMELTQKSYDIGSSSLIDLLTAKKSFYNLQIMSANSKANSSINLVAVYKEMGGFGTRRQN